MSDENFYLVCETCGEFVKDPIDHAFETGHRRFRYVGIVRDEGRVKAWKENLMEGRVGDIEEVKE